MYDLIDWLIDLQGRRPHVVRVSHHRTCYCAVHNEMCNWNVYIVRVKNVHSTTTLNHLARWNSVDITSPASVARRRPVSITMISFVTADSLASFAKLIRGAVAQGGAMGRVSELQSTGKFFTPGPWPLCDTSTFIPSSPLRKIPVERLKVINLHLQNIVLFNGSSVPIKLCKLSKIPSQERDFIWGECNVTPQTTPQNASWLVQTKGVQLIWRLEKSGTEVEGHNGGLAAVPPSGIQGQSSVSGGQGTTPWSWRHFTGTTINVYIHIQF